MIETGGKELDPPGYDLTGLLTGSEGTMALVTKIIVRLMRQPEAVKTLLAIYDSTAEAGNTVAALTARGITPVALEMLDGPMLRMVEEATHAGYPLDAAAVLLIELEGLTKQCRGAGRTNRCRVHRLLALAKSASPAPRPNATCSGKAARMPSAQSAVSARPIMCRTAWFRAPKSRRRSKPSTAIGRKYELAISNVFHAGDGNMHPIIPFDPRKPGDLQRAQQAGEEILRFCLSVGGSITGEHGVGMEKMELMGEAYLGRYFAAREGTQKPVRSARAASIPGKSCRRANSAAKSASRPV